MMIGKYEIRQQRRGPSSISGIMNIARNKTVKSGDHTNIHAERHDSLFKECAKHKTVERSKTDNQ